MKENNAKILIFCVTIFFAFFLSLANIILGDLNQDEGWYLYAAKLISAGKIIYRDFAFPQGPVMSLFYSFFISLVNHFGLLGGRALTALIGFLTIFVSAFLAYSVAEDKNKVLSALLVFILIGVNVYQSYYFSVVKTYALTSFFLVIGFYALYVAIKNASKFMAFVSGFFVILSAGVRASVYFIIPIILFAFWGTNNKKAMSLTLSLILGMIASFSMTVLPFLVLAPENFMFFVFKYHSLRDYGSLFTALAFKCGFLSRLVQAYFVSVALFISVLILNFPFKNKKDHALKNSPKYVFEKLVWLSILVITVVHFLAPFPYDDYQVFLYPLFVVAVSLFTSPYVSSELCNKFLWIVLLVCIASSFSSPINQDWFIQGRDRIWWLPKDKPPILKLREVARFIKSLDPKGRLLLTQDPYLAIESGKQLPQGLELGQFSFFPQMSDEEAMERRVLNRNLFEALLKNCDAKVAALSGYAFAISSPSIVPVTEEDRLKFESIVLDRYELIRVIPNFGQASTTLRIFVKKE